jgi:hypothetical protein
MRALAKFLKHRTPATRAFLFRVDRSGAQPMKTEFSMHPIPPLERNAS